MRGVVGHHREHDVGRHRRLRRTCRDASTCRTQRFGAGGIAIEDMYVMPGLDQVNRNRGTHRAKSYKSNFHDEIPNDQPNGRELAQTAS